MHQPSSPLSMSNDSPNPPELWVPAVLMALAVYLFREGQGIVAEGAMDARGVFVASKVLAKHDENYMSPEVQAALEASGASPDNHQLGSQPET